MDSRPNALICLLLLWTERDDLNLPFSRSGLPRMILARNRKLPFLLPPSPLPLNTAVCPTLVKKLSWKSCRSKGSNFSRQKEKFQFSVRYMKLAIESADIPFEFIRHRGDDSVIPVAVRGLDVSRKNPAGQWDGGRTITFSSKISTREGKDPDG